MLAAATFSSGKKLAGGSGRIDTGSHDISFAGGSIASFTKAGSGRLSLNDSGTGSISVEEGTLSLGGAESTQVRLSNSTLEATGGLGYLSATSQSVIDIGVHEIAELSADFFYSSTQEAFLNSIADLMGQTSDLFSANSSSIFSIEREGFFEVLVSQSRRCFDGFRLQVDGNLHQ